METFTPFQWVRSLSRVPLLAILGLMVAVSVPTMAHANFLSEATLIWTEDYNDIGTELRFGQSVTDTLIFNGTTFAFSRGLSVGGDLSASGSATINADAVGNAELIFTHSTGTAGIVYNDTTKAYEITDDVTVTGTITGTSLVLTGLTGCTVFQTDATGLVSCAGFAGLDGRYVNIGGDTMTGTLFVGNGAGINASGSITTQTDLSADGNATINADNTAADAVFTFGGAVPSNITLSNAKDWFAFSNDVQVTGNVGATGNITASGNVVAAGNLSGNTLTVSSGAVNINGLQYQFTGTAATAGQVLVNDGTGNLAWGNSAVGNGSGSFVSFHPEFPNTTYVADGSDNTGQLTTGEDTGENVYNWTTSRPTLQDYDIVVRLKVPDNFVSWAATTPASLRYKTSNASTAISAVEFDVYDTTGTIDHNGAASASVAFADLTATLGGTYTAGGYMTVRIKVSADSGDTATVSRLELNWLTSTP